MKDKYVSLYWWTKENLWSLSQPIINSHYRASGVAQVLEHLPSNHEILRSNPIITKRNKQT
jgi:hypothetical protein